MKKAYVSPDVEFEVMEEDEFLTHPSWAKTEEIEDEEEFDWTQEIDEASTESVTEEDL